MGYFKKRKLEKEKKLKQDATTLGFILLALLDRLKDNHSLKNEELVDLYDRYVKVLFENLSSDGKTVLNKAILDLNESMKILNGTDINKSIQNVKDEVRKIIRGE